jgi:hypothetical protein
LEIKSGVFEGNESLKIPLKNVQDDAEFAGTLYLGNG